MAQLVAELLPRPLSLEQLRAGPRQRLLPSHAAEELLEEREQLLVERYAQLPVDLAELARLAEVSAGLAIVEETNVGLELSIEPRVREIAGPDGHRAGPDERLGVEPLAAPRHPGLQAAVPERLDGVEHRQRVNDGDPALEPVVPNLLREGVVLASRWPVSADERLGAERHAHALREVGLQARYEVTQVLERRVAHDQQDILRCLEIRVRDALDRDVIAGPVVRKDFGPGPLVTLDVRGARQQVELTSGRHGPIVDGVPTWTGSWSASQAGTPAQGVLHAALDRGPRASLDLRQRVLDEPLDVRLVLGKQRVAERSEILGIGHGPTQQLALLLAAGARAEQPSPARGEDPATDLDQAQDVGGIAVVAGVTRREPVAGAHELTDLLRVGLAGRDEAQELTDLVEVTGLREAERHRGR